MLPVGYNMSMNQYTCYTPSRDKIIKEYLNKPNASITTASATLGITRKVLWRCLKIYGIRAKSRGRPNIQRKDYIFNVKSFQREYSKSGVTIRQCAEKIGISTDTLRRLMRFHKIQTKPWRNTYQQPTILAKITKKDIEQAYLLNLKASLDKAAKLLKVSRNALSRAIKKLGLRCKPKFRTGELHPNWNGGTSYHPLYPWKFVQKRKIILARDGNKCILCQKTKNSMRYKRDLSVHHIDYDKNNCVDSNLVSLCHFCHGKTNYNRTKWITVFQQYIRKLKYN